MGLETVTHIDDLDANNPLGSDARSQGDDHIRNIKLALKTDFPSISGPMTCTQAELNVLDGVTAGTVLASGGVVVDASKKVNEWLVDNITIDGNTVTATTGALNLTPAAGSAIVLDGTVNVDAGVITGATSITSTAFVGDITGDVTGNADTATSATTAGTVTTAAQTNITSLGTLTALQTDNININGNTISSTDTAGDINITPDTTGDVVLDGVKWPQADGSANQILVTDGVGQSSWGTPVTTTALTTQGDILYRDASGLQRLGFGTSGQLLKTQGTGANPTWSSVTPANTDLSIVAGDIIYGSGTDTWARLAKGSDDEVLTLASGVPSWAAASGGKIIQMVSTQTGTAASGTTLVPNDDTIPQITEGVEFLTLAITPTSTSNYLLVEVVLNAMTSTSATITIMSLYNTDVHATNSQATVVGQSGDGSGTNRPVCLPLRHYLIAPTTSATTFRIRAGGHQATTTAINASFGGTTRKMGGAYASTMTITEIQP